MKGHAIANRERQLHASAKHERIRTIDAQGKSLEPVNELPRLELAQPW